MKVTFITCILWIGVGLGCGQTPLPAFDPSTPAVGQLKNAEALSAPLYEIPFDEQPGGALRNSVALTFDDGPDTAGHTETVLDALRQAGVPATFFVNARNQETDVDVHRDARAQATLRRIVEEGHELGNHTAHHLDLGTLSAPAVAAEIDAVEALVQGVLRQPNLRLRLLRTPYGRPMYAADRRDRPALFAKVAQAIAPRAVHVGWNIDTNDWQDKSPAQPLEEMDQALLSGKRGVILMHSVHARTATALPAIIALLRDKFHVDFVTCGQYVEAAYGQAPADLLPGRDTGAGVQWVTR